MDPVFQATPEIVADANDANPFWNLQEDKWYFWNETWADCEGPYDTETICREKLDDYHNWLNKPSSTEDRTKTAEALLIKERGAEWIMRQQCQAIVEADERIPWDIRNELTLRMGAKFDLVAWAAGEGSLIIAELDKLKAKVKELKADNLQLRRDNAHLCGELAQEKCFNDSLIRRVGRAVECGRLLTG